MSTSDVIRKLADQLELDFTGNESSLEQAIKDVSKVREYWWFMHGMPSCPEFADDGPWGEVRVEIVPRSDDWMQWRNVTNDPTDWNQFGPFAVSVSLIDPDGDTVDGWVERDGDINKGRNPSSYPFRKITDAADAAHAALAKLAGL